MEFANVPDIGEFSERERESQPSSSKRLKGNCSIACCQLYPRDSVNAKSLKSHKFGLSIKVRDIISYLIEGANKNYFSFIYVNYRICISYCRKSMSNHNYSNISTKSLNRL